MALLIRNSMGKTLYGIVFVVALPLALTAWAYGLRNVVHAHAVRQPIVGVVISLLGLALVTSGMLSLWRTGGGLPMNAYPPPRLVTQGVYALLPHPIYVGFVLVCAGISIFSGSASGVWLVTPIVALACAALVFGYESPDLNQRFGRDARRHFLPDDNETAPTPTDRVRAYLLVLIPWIFIYELFVALGPPSDAVSTYFPFERHIPVWQWTEIIYFSTYLVVGLAPLFLQTARALRRFILNGWLSIAFVFPLYWLLPFIAAPRGFVASSTWGRLLQFERLADSSAASFPSFHVIWACIAAGALSSRRNRMVWYVWALLVCASCISTGSHSILDIAAGFATVIGIFHAERIWRGLLRLAEGIANSWHEWRIGPLRIINHGAYAAVGVLLGMLILDTFLGSSGDLVVISIFFCSSLGAVLWAQFVEGSPALLRPLGFYGGLVGGVIGSLVAPAVGVPVWTALAALAVAAPVIQGVGRLRCIVQGCCHGRPTHSVPGIRCTNPNSRVCRLAGLRDVEVHPTALYSLLWNAFILVVLIRLLTLHTTSTMICGMYLLLGGIGRFVEEAYRGEPQTLIIWGLRLYQWIAIATVVAGAFLTTLTNAPLAPTAQPRFHSLPTAIICGVLAWFVSAIDFPDSARRFARLT